MPLTWRFLCGDSKKRAKGHPLSTCRLTIKVYPTHLVDILSIHLDLPHTTMSDNAPPPEEPLFAGLKKKSKKAKVNFDDIDLAGGEDKPVTSANVATETVAQAEEQADADAGEGEGEDMFADLKKKSKKKKKEIPLDLDLVSRRYICPLLGYPGRISIQTGTGC